MYLPSSFCPGLKEPVPNLGLEGAPHELDFVNFPEIVVNLQSPFGEVIIDQRDTD